MQRRHRSIVSKGRPDVGACGTRWKTGATTTRLSVPVATSVLVIAGTCIVLVSHRVMEPTVCTTSDASQRAMAIPASAAADADDPLREAPIIAGPGQARSASPVADRGVPERAGRATSLRRLTRPVEFEQNLGQTAPEVSFLARSGGDTLFVTGDGAVVRGPAGAVRMRLVGSRTPSAADGVARVPGVSHYYGGPDPAAWIEDVPHFGGVRCAGVYDGIDFVLRAGARAPFEYDFVLAPGADPERISLRFEGCEPPVVAGDGSLLLRTGRGFVRHRAPRVVTAGGAADARFRVRPDATVAIDVPGLDRSLGAVIDPEIEVATYLGGSSSEYAFGVAVAADGTMALVGTTSSSDFPLQDAVDTTQAGYEAFVTRWAADGSQVLSSTYFGGAAWDAAACASFDGTGRLHFGGLTLSSSDLPLRNEIQASAGGAPAGFVATLSSTGTLLFSTYLGGSGSCAVWGLRADGDSAAVLGGKANGPDFHGAGATQGDDGFVLRLGFTPAAQGISAATEWVRLLGGPGTDEVRGVAPAGDGGAFACGSTNSDGLATPGTPQATIGGGTDGMLARIGTSGTVAWLTYLGTSGNDFLGGVDDGPGGRPTVVGASAGFTGVNPFQTAGNAMHDAIVARFEADGSAIVWASPLGGTSYDAGYSIDVDAAGRSAVAGHVVSTNLPYVAPVQAAAGVATLAAVIAADGASVEFSTSFGTSTLLSDQPTVADHGQCVAFAPDGDVVFGGTVIGSIPATASAADGTKDGFSDGYLARISVAAPDPVPTLGVVTTKGRLTSSARTRRDAATFRGTFEFLPESDGSFDPATDAVRLTVGGTDGPAVAQAPAGDPRWKRKWNARKGRTTWTWKSAKRIVPRASLRFVIPATGAGTFKASVGGFDFGAGGTTGPVTTRVELGSDFGLDTDDWRTVKATRRWP